MPYVKKLLLRLKEADRVLQFRVQGPQINP